MSCIQRFEGIMVVIVISAALFIIFLACIAIIELPQRLKRIEDAIRTPGGRRKDNDRGNETK